MNEKDLEQIERLLTSKLDEMSATFDEKLSSKLDEVTTAFDQKLERMSGTFDQKLDAVSEMLSKEFTTGLVEAERRMENLIGVLEKKVDLVIEGQQALVERIDRMELVQTEVNRNVDRRISTLSADLAGHKADSYAHRRGYSVKENEESIVYQEPEGEL